MFRNPSSDEDLVSIIIPTYYRNDLLRKTLESVEQQSYNPIEPIVVDDSGERYAEPVVEDYDVKYVGLDGNKGAQAARNDGINHSNGKYINLLDDDDRIQKDKIEKQVSILRERKNIGVVYCGKQLETGRQVLPNENVQGDVLKYALMFQMTPSSPSTMLIRRETLDRILPLSDRPGADDIGIKIELARVAEFEFIDEPLVIQSVGQDTRGNSMGAVEGRKQILQEYADLYNQYPSEVYKTALAHTYLLEADTILNDRAWSSDAIKAAGKALYHIPGTRYTFLGYFLASWFGRLGKDLAFQVYSNIVLGQEHRGGIT